MSTTQSVIKAYSGSWMRPKKSSATTWSASEACWRRFMQLVPAQAPSASAQLDEKEWPAHGHRLRTNFQGIGTVEIFPVQKDMSATKQPGKVSSKAGAA